MQIKAVYHFGYAPTFFYSGGWITPSGAIHSTLYKVIIGPKARLKAVIFGAWYGAPELETEVEEAVKDEVYGAMDSTLAGVTNPSNWVEDRKWWDVL